MLIITRRVSQSFVIVPDPGINPATPIGELFQARPIEVSIAQVAGVRVKLSITADERLLILRRELFQNGA